MSQSAEIKLAEQRLSVLELAKALGNVSAACKQRGMSRTQYYEMKRRFQVHGIEGLVDLPPVHHSHPATTPPEVEQRILDVSLEHRRGAAIGCATSSSWQASTSVPLPSRRFSTATRWATATAAGSSWKSVTANERSN